MTMRTARFQVYVYGLRDGEDLRYIGVSRDIRARISRHCRDAKTGSPLPVHRWIRKNGRPDFCVLACAASYDEAYALEKGLISEMRAMPICNLLNVCSGGRGGDASKGKPLSPRHKKAISRANKGQNLGVPMPEETRKAISRATKGIKKGPMSPERVAAMSKRLRGVPRGPMSEETKRNLGDSLKVAWVKRREKGLCQHSEQVRSRISAGVRAAIARRAG
jgi:predicted GIY-YIG superfamily endonuclease